MGLRRLARQMRTGRRKAALAVGYAGYVEAAQAAGQVVVSKRAWRAQVADAPGSDDKNALSAEGGVGMADWMEAAQGALSRLDGEQWADKKKATILALVDAHLAGRSEETVWDKPETCARNTYHAKWKRDALFADVLVEVDGLAKGWRDGRSLRALNKAAESLALAAPVAVTKLMDRLESEDEAIILRAAMAILDRAGMETAAKSSSQVDGVMIVVDK